MPQGTVIYNKHGKTNIKIIIALNMIIGNDDDAIYFHLNDQTDLNI